MVIFNSYVKLPEGKHHPENQTWLTGKSPIVDFPSYRPPCSAGSYLLCMFDYWRVGCCWAILGQTNAGWWFGILNMALIFPYIGNNHPNWLSYFSEGLKPPTSHMYSFPTVVSKIWLVEVFFTSVSENEIKSCGDGWSCQCRISENFVACTQAQARTSWMQDVAGQWWPVMAFNAGLQKSGGWTAGPMSESCVSLTRSPQAAGLERFSPKKRSILKGWRGFISQQCLIAGWYPCFMVDLWAASFFSPLHQGSFSASWRRTAGLWQPQIG